MNIYSIGCWWLPGRKEDPPGSHCLTFAAGSFLLHADRVCAVLCSAGLQLLVVIYRGLVLGMHILENHKSSVHTGGRSQCAGQLVH